jgi:hypothetical protein
LLLNLSGTRLTNFHLTNLAAQVASANFVSLGSDRFRVEFQRQSGASLLGNLTLARLAFAAVQDEHSAVAVLRGEALTGVRTDALTANGRAGVGRVFIVGREPILDVTRSNSSAALTMYALPGQTYAIERATALGGANAWTFDRYVTPTSLRTDLPPRPASAPVEFFRARTEAASTRLSIRLEGNQAVIEWSLDCVGCVLLQSPSIGPDAAWTPNGTQPQVVNGRYQVKVTVTAQPRFLRLIPPP